MALPVMIARAGHSTAAPYFHPNSIWNRPIGASPTVDPNSATYINYLLANGGDSTTIDGISNRWSCPIWTAPNGTATQVVRGDNGFESITGNVPIPSPFYWSPDSDAKAGILDAGSDYFWSFWGMYQSAGQYVCGYGAFGAFYRTSSFGDGLTGHGRSDGNGWGGRATGFNYLGGIITREDMMAGVIAHKLVIIFPGQAIRPNTYRWPARGTDGYAADTVNSIQEGALVQLDPSFDISGYTAQQQVIGNCLKTYGAWLGDRGDLVGLNAVEYLTSDGQNIDSAPWSGLLTASGFPVSFVPHLRVLSVTQSDYYVEP